MAHINRSPRGRLRNTPGDSQRLLNKVLDLELGQKTRCLATRHSFSHQPVGEHTGSADLSRRRPIIREAARSFPASWSDFPSVRSCPFLSIAYGESGIHPITKIFETGASDDGLVSVSGHKDRQMLNIYSLKSYKKALAAMKVRWANRENEKAPADDQAEDAA